MRAPVGANDNNQKWRALSSHLAASSSICCWLSVVTCNTSPIQNKLDKRPSLKQLEYDTLSANVVKSFPKLAKSESGQIVSEKVKLTYFDVYLSHTM